MTHSTAVTVQQRWGVRLKGRTNSLYSQEKKRCSGAVDLITAHAWGDDATAAADTAASTRAGDDVRRRLYNTKNQWVDRMKLFGDTAF